MQLVLLALAQVCVPARRQVPVQPQARWELPVLVPVVVLERAEVLAAAERGLLALGVQPAQVLLMFPRQRVLEQALAAPEVPLQAGAPNPVLQQEELPKVPEWGLLFLPARCVVLLLLVEQIAVERVHAAQAPQQVLAAAAEAEPAI